MPVIGEQLPALVLDGVQVAKDLDMPTAGILVNLVLLGDVEGQARLAAKSHRIGEGEAVRYL
jgi:hypothetical protein